MFTSYVFFWNFYQKMRAMVCVKARPAVTELSTCEKEKLAD